ncbi:phenylalanine--tRNA ligase subunit alpha [Thermocrinis sp.]
MNLEEIESQAKQDLEKVLNLQELQQVKAKYLGKKGYITLALKEIAHIPPEQRREYGAKINRIKGHLEALFKEAEERLRKAEIERELLASWEELTVSLPKHVGAIHPISQTLARIKEIFLTMGFSVEEGPEVELESYNFDLLNIPKEHPARDMQDTFYVNKEGYLLRTHTSPVQIRVMLSQKPPIYMVAPGRVYRRDDDPTHSPVFHQVEGLVVDGQANFKHMKYTIEVFLREFFEREVPVRFRASYFPFTEPSAEVDIGCLVCGGAGCRVCKGGGWLEVMGCGMVHPKVLENCGIDSELYQGFAFGMGVERLCMLYFGIDNIKLFYENDLRFLRQFRWS